MSAGTMRAFLAATSVTLSTCLVFAQVAPPTGDAGAAGDAGQADAAVLAEASIPPEASTPQVQRPAPPSSARAAPAPPAAPAPTAVTIIQSPPPTTAVVDLYADYPQAWLELRNYLEAGPWTKACQAPCGKQLSVDGMEARVTADGMSSSNPFFITPGTGRARFKISGGSQTLRDLGTWGLIIGIPVSMVGMGLYGYGRAIEDDEGARTAGIATMVVGGLIVLGSLPLLIAGATKVRDSGGKTIARDHGLPRVF